MELIVIHRETAQILYQGELIIIPGIGSTIYVDNKPFIDKINSIVDGYLEKGGIKEMGYDDHGKLPSNFRMITDRYQLENYASRELRLNPMNFTTVLDLEHCPITGDTKAFVGSSNKLQKLGKTDSKVVNKKPKNGSNGNRDDGFLDGFLLTGLLLS